MNKMRRAYKRSLNARLVQWRRMQVAMRSLRCAVIANSAAAQINMLRSTPIEQFGSEVAKVAAIAETVIRSYEALGRALRAA